MSTRLASLLAVEKTGEGEYSSRNLPVKMGNTTPIAYGGSVLGVAFHAAYPTVPGTHKLYSLLGHFLGPTSPDKTLRCKVTRTRDTKSFATRRVEISQIQDSGKFRAVMELIADFHVVEKGMFEYSAMPTRSYSSPVTSHNLSSQGESLVKKGMITAKQLEIIKPAFEANERFFETRLALKYVSIQNHNSTPQAVKTHHEASITANSSAEWYMAREHLECEKDQLGTLAFLMDGGLDILPLEHSYCFPDDAGACTSLDFAMRVFQPHVDLNHWHIRERTTTAGGYGRTYSESRLWDEQGEMVASMTQQSILRPNKPKANI